MLVGKRPRSALALSSAWATCIPVMARSASRQTHSRVNWSTTVRMRNDRPSANLSLIKSMLQQWCTSLSDARRKIETLRHDYKQQHPHSSLHYYRPPSLHGHERTCEH